MKKIEVATATGAALDWLVAQCLGAANEHFMTQWEQGHRNYSTDWAQGGPVSESAHISVNYDASGRYSDGWRAFSDFYPIMFGSTELMAKMRSFVAGKLGNTVEIPDNL